MDLNSFLLRNRIVFLSQRIGDTVAIQVVASLLALDSLNPEEEIKLYINCPQVGGWAGTRAAWRTPTLPQGCVAATSCRRSACSDAPC